MFDRTVVFIICFNVIARGDGWIRGGLNSLLCLIGLWYLLFFQLNLCQSLHTFFSHLPTMIIILVYDFYDTSMMDQIE